MIARQFCSALRRLGSFQKSIAPFLLLREGPHAIFHIFEGAEYRRLILTQSLFLQDVLHFDVLPDGAALDNRPGKVADNAPRSAPRRKQMVAGKRLKPDRAGQCEFG